MYSFSENTHVLKQIFSPRDILIDLVKNGALSTNAHFWLLLITNNNKFKNEFPWDSSNSLWLQSGSQWILININVHNHFLASENIVKAKFDA